MADSFLSQEELEDIIGQVAKSKEGKTAIQNAMGEKDAKFIARFNDLPISERDDQLMTKKANEMKNILFKHITKDTQENGRTGLARFPKSAIIIGNPVPIQNTGMYRIDISFNPNSLIRASLNPDAYPSGISDIISVFVHGYSAHGSVVGTWHGEEGVWSLRHRDPNDFMSRAVDEFNAKNKKDGLVEAKLIGDYIN